MAKQDTKRGRCPNCCPDGGAIFKAEVDFNEAGELVRVWKCCNCPQRLPRKTYRRESAKMTASQAKVFDRLAADFGGVLQTQWVGRKVYVTATNEARRWFEGIMVGGFIGPRGSYKLTLYRLGGDVVVEDGVAWSVYLTTKKEG